MKRPVSIPNILEGTTESVSEELGVNVSDSIVNYFKDKYFIDNVMSDVFQLIMTVAINPTVAKANCRKSLFAPIKILTVFLEKKKVDVVEKRLNEKEDIIAKQDEKIALLRTELDQIQIKTDELEQYGRRTSSPLFSVPLPNSDDCENTVLEVINEKLKIDISRDEIERCHPLGPKQVIVQFKSYKSKAAVNKAKTNLKGNEAKIFLTEDLTKRNHAIIEALLVLRTTSKINSFRSIDGTSL